MGAVTYRVKPLFEKGTCALPVPIEPREAFGRVRAPVVVTLGACVYRSTVAVMGDRVFIPLRHSHQVACGLDLSGEVEVTLALDEAPRLVEVPAGLAVILDADPRLRTAWEALSTTHQREYVEALAEARRPQTRVRRLEHLVARLQGLP